MAGITIRRSSAGRVATGALCAAAVVLAVACAGCAPSPQGQEADFARERLIELQTPTSAWWADDGAYVVLQTVGEDSRLVAVAWDRKSKKTRTYPGFRVVDVEPHEPRFWVVPDSRTVPAGLHDKGEAHVIDIAGDGIDSRPDELFVIELDGSAKPRADVDARYRAWVGPANYSASVEIDVNKGSCPGTLRFSSAGSSLNAWSAKVPTDVVTFEPIGWSPTGRYFAVITQADASATTDAVAAWTKAYQANVDKAEKAAAAAGDAPTDIEKPPPPTCGAAILVFSAADGTLAARHDVRMPVLEPNAGANLAAWDGSEDLLLFLGQGRDAPALGAMTPRGYVNIGWARTYGAEGPPRLAWFAGVDEGAPILAEMWDSPKLREIRVGMMSESEGKPDAVRGSIIARWSGKAGMLSAEGPDGGKGTSVHVSTSLSGAPKKGFSVAGP